MSQAADTTILAGQSDQYGPKVAAHYDLAYATPLGLKQDARVLDLLAELWGAMQQPDVTGPPMVLDVGCGTGRLLDLWPMPSSHYLGVDPSRWMLGHAVGRHPMHRFKCGMLAPGWLAAESFDLVVSLYALNHSADPAAEMALWHRALKPGGAVFAVVPSQYRDEGDNPLELDVGQTFNCTQLEDVAREAGFDGAAKPLDAYGQYLTYTGAKR